MDKDVRLIWEAYLNEPVILETKSVFVTGYKYHMFNGILDTIHYLQSKVPISYKEGEIAPDGNDALEQQGVINFYFNTNSSQSKMKEYGYVDMPFNKALQLAKTIEHWLHEAGVVVGKISKPERSNSYDYRHVIRFEIVHLPEPPEDEAPGSGTISNDNIDAVMQTLKYPIEDAYTIPAKEILYKIREFVMPSDVEQNVRKPSSEVGDQGAKVYDPGIDDAYIRKSISTIERIAQWAVDNDYPTITIS
jgi:hypothetical protein